MKNKNKKATNFYDLPDKEREAIITRAAKAGAKMQRETLKKAVEICWRCEKPWNGKGEYCSYCGKSYKLPPVPQTSSIPEKKIRLTKKRLVQLDLAITMDDILYEKYHRIMEGIHKAERDLAHRKSILKVIQVKGDANYLLRIDKVISTPEGTIVYVL
jgi:hypothetical protein